MASAVVNNRLEGHTRGTDLRPGLQAGVHDALWLLARQRQLGEFDGLDAGTPIGAAIVVHAVPIAAWQPKGEQSVAYDRSTPLEALVEAGGYRRPGAIGSRPGCAWRASCAVRESTRRR